MENNNPLMRTHLNINIIDLMVEYQIEHRFVNQTDNNIEAIFSFPIPLDAAFISMQAEIAGEILTSQIMPAKKAIAEYDNAISDGNSAVILERVEDGLLCVSLGNLAVGEEGIIRFTFADHLSVFDRTARFALPMVNRPRYGRSHLSPFAQIEHDFAINHPMSADIQITGLLKESIVECLTHPISYQNTDKSLQLSLTHAMLDRDFIVQFKTQDQLPMQGYLVPEQDHHIGLINLIAPPSKQTPSNINLALVMDCSGSMNGDAINQSRSALKAILSQLNPEDYIQVLRFGNEVFSLLKRPMKATNPTLSSLNMLVDAIDANLGGTEIGLALDAALEQLSTRDQTNRVIILVTDGAVEPEEISKAKLTAAEQNVRIFIVAVSSSASVDVLKPLADATNGVLERAIPCEPIHGCVTRLFTRARELSPCELMIDAPEQSKSLPVDVFYPNDGAICMLQLPKPVDQLTVTINSEQQQIPCHIETEHHSMLCALYGQRLYQTTINEQKEQIALQYQLLTKHTSAVLVKEREQQLDLLPEIKKVPQMYASGMVSSGFNNHYDSLDIPAFLRKRPSDICESAPQKIELQATMMPPYHETQSFWQKIKNRLNRLLKAFLRFLFKSHR